MRYYGYDEFIKDMKTLHGKLKNENIEGILLVLRGGATPAHFLAEALGIKNIYAVNILSYDGKKKICKPKITNLPKIPESIVKVAIIDEIVDSGETMSSLMTLLCKKYPDKIFKSVTIFQRDNAKFYADIYAQSSDEWIEFFWERDLKDII